MLCAICESAQFSNYAARLAAVGIRVRFMVTVRVGVRVGVIPGVARSVGLWVQHL